MGKSPIDTILSLGGDILAPFTGGASALIGNGVASADEFAHGNPLGGVLSALGAAGPAAQVFGGAAAPAADAAAGAADTGLKLAGAPSFASSVLSGAGVPEAAADTIGLSGAPQFASGVLSGGAAPTAAIDSLSLDGPTSQFVSQYGTGTGSTAGATGSSPFDKAAGTAEKAVLPLALQTLLGIQQTPGISAAPAASVTGKSGLVGAGGGAGPGLGAGGLDIQGGTAPKIFPYVQTGSGSGANSSGSQIIGATPSSNAGGQPNQQQPKGI